MRHGCPLWEIPASCHGPRGLDHRQGSVHDRVRAPGHQAWPSETSLKHSPEVAKPRWEIQDPRQKRELEGGVASAPGPRAPPAGRQPARQQPGRPRPGAGQCQGAAWAKSSHTPAASAQSRRLLIKQKFLTLPSHHGFLYLPTPPSGAAPTTGLANYPLRWAEIVTQCVCV